MLSLSIRPLSIAILALVGLLGLGAETLHATVITNGCADANQSCSLNELVAGGSIIIDDKRFDAWFVDDFSSIPVDLGSIEALLLDDQPLNPGLQFDSNGEFSTVGFDLIDVFLGFTVSTLDGSARIKDNSLEINGFDFGAGNVGGFIQIFEDLFDGNGNLIGEKFVTADNLDPPIFDLFDTAQFTPQPQIFVETSILLSGDGPGDTVSLDRFTQKFSQIPEPSALILVGVGLAALGLSRKRSPQTDKQFRSSGAETRRC